jgi:glutathione S-transferase
VAEPHLELVSFKTCPYVQRAIIVLREKRVPVDVTYIDRKNPPDWFRRISPLGKVPLLKVDDAVLFESAVIAEYLDEVYPPRLHPADALRRAHNRAWIEFCSTLISEQIRMLEASDRSALDAGARRLNALFDRLEAELGPGPFFNGPSLALIDCAFAPLLMRTTIMEPYLKLGVFSERPRLRNWRDALLERDSVRQSVVPDFAKLLIDNWRKRAPLGRELFGEPQD